jgi:hypothetical protein
MNTKLITFSCSEDSILENYPPVPASKIIPEWYKDIPPFAPIDKNYIPTDGIGSVKKCIPVLDYMTTGYIIKNPFHSVISKKYEDGYHATTSISTKDQYIGSQPHHQCPVKINDQKNHYVKIHQPWLIKTPPGYSCFYYQPHYLFNKTLEILPGIIDTDKFSEPVSLVSILHSDSVTLEPDEPLVVVFPFKRDEWSMEIKKFDHTSNSIFKFMLLRIWHGTYQKLIHTKKRFL